MNICTCTCILYIYIYTHTMYMFQDQATELHGVPLKQHGGKKRNIISVADPTDILSNMQLARLPLEQSSELTRGLGLEDVRRLNRKHRGQRLHSPPTDRLKLFSFSLRLPFSRGKAKKEKRVNIRSSPDKVSPKRRGSKHELRNKRLSRSAAGECQLYNTVYVNVHVHMYIHCRYTL